MPAVWYKFLVTQFRSIETIEQRFCNKGSLNPTTNAITSRKQQVNSILKSYPISQKNLRKSSIHNMKFGKVYINSPYTKDIKTKIFVFKYASNYELPFPIALRVARIQISGFTQQGTSPEATYRTISACTWSVCKWPVVWRKSLVTQSEPFEPFSKAPRIDLQQKKHFDANIVARISGRGYNA